MNSTQSTQTPHRFANHQFVFLLVWWTGFFIYPLWYLPAPDTARIAACGILFILMAVCCLMLRFIARWNAAWGAPPEEQRESIGFFAILFTIAFAAHIPFLPWPILSGLDTIDHAAVPAVIASKVVRKLSGVLGFSIQPLCAGLAVLLFAALMVIPPFRKYLFDKFAGLSRWIDAHYGAAMFVLAVLTGFYVALLLAWRPLDRFDDLNPLFRYPPLSKFFSIPLYALFGLREWTGRVMQIAFTFGGAIYLYRITRLYGGVTASRIAALLFVFLPPVFHYGNTTMLEGGSLFFIIAAFFYWIRFVEYKTQSDLIQGTLFATLACLYKHPAVSLIPAFAYMVACDFLFPKGKFTTRYLIPSIFACAIPAITIVLFMKLSGFNSDVPSSLQRPTFELLIGNLRVMPQGISYPIACLFLAGLLALPVLSGWRTLSIFIGWIGTHYLLTCMSAAALNVRQALPYYVGLIVPAALIAGKLCENYRRFQAGLVYGVLPVFLLWVCLFKDRNLDYRLVGRAMGDRSYINFSNWNSMYLPYPKTIQALQEITQSGDVIYAPMINEPVKFYLEKYPLTDRAYRRELWAASGHQDLDSLTAYCRHINAKWLVVPRGRWLYDPQADLRWIEKLFTDSPTPFTLIRTISYGTEQIGIWKIESLRE